MLKLIVDPDSTGLESGRPAASVVVAGYVFQDATTARLTVSDSTQWIDITGLNAAQAMMKTGILSAAGGSGDVTALGTLSTNRLIIGQGTTDIAASSFLSVDETNGYLGINGTPTVGKLQLVQSVAGSPTGKVHGIYSQMSTSGNLGGASSGKSGLVQELYYTATNPSSALASISAAAIVNLKYGLASNGTTVNSPVGGASAFAAHSTIYGQGDANTQYSLYYGGVRANIGTGYATNYPTSGSGLGTPTGPVGGIYGAFDMNVQGPIAVQPDIMACGVIFQNNYYNGTASLGATVGLTIVTNPANGGEQDAVHTAATTYPNDYAIIIKGNSGALVSSTGIGWTTAIGVGEITGAPWATVDGRSHIGTVLKANAYDVGLDLTGRFTASVGPDIRIAVTSTSTASSTERSFDQLFTLNPASDSAVNFQAARHQISTASASGRNYSGTLTTLNTGLFNSSTGTITNAFGHTITVANSVAGTISAARGVNVVVSNSVNTGVITTAQAVFADIQNTGAASTMTDAYYFRIRSMTVQDGTITNTYGYYCGDITLGTQTNGAFAFYNSDANARSFFAGGVICQSAALATNATEGFLYIPTCAGTPTGTPVARTGTVAMVFDTTNNKLYIYDGSWLGGTAPGAWS